MNNARYNILFLNSGKSWGGNEKWMYIAAHALAENHQVLVAYRRDIVGKRFRVRKYKLPFANEADGYTIFRLMYLIVRYRIHILIPTKPKEYFISGMLAKLFRRVNIVRLGIVRDLNDSHIKKFVYHTLTDGIIVNAASIRDHLLQSSFMRPEKIRVIYNGVNTAEIDALAEASVPIKLNQPFLITAMGKLTNRKAFDIVLRGFAEFVNQSKINNAGLIIIGAGEKSGALQKLAEDAGVTNYVHFTGFIENPYPYLKVSQVFISASKNEGLANALLEAMYLNNAVITTRAGGSEYAVEHGQNGFLLNDEPVSEIASHLTKLYQDQLLTSRMAKRSYQIIMEKFSMERMKEQMEVYFNEVLQVR